MDTVRNATVQREEHVAWGRLVPVGLLAAVATAVVNTAVYFIAARGGVITQDVVVNGQGPITPPMIAAASVFGAVAGTIVYAVVGRFVSRPVRVFRVIAAVALALSFIGPLTIPGAPAAMVATLLLMHGIAAAVIVGLLTTLARRG